VADGVVEDSEAWYPVTPTLSVADMDRVTDVELAEDAPWSMKLVVVVFAGAVVSEEEPLPPPEEPPPPPHVDKATKTVK
jgi:hypothetical protein